jgi:hypothetical protein
LPKARRLSPAIIVFTIALPTVLCGGLTLLAASCGGASAPPPPTQSPAAAQTTPAATPSTNVPASHTPSPAVTPATFAIPAGAAYDDAVGGRYQLVSWSLGAGGVSARLVMVAAPDARASDLHTQTIVGTGVVDLRLRDTRVQFTTAKQVRGAAGGLVARAALVFPPDDALIVVHLTLTAGKVARAAATVTGPASGRFFLVTLQLKE